MLPVLGEFIVRKRVFFGFVFAAGFLMLAKPTPTSIGLGFLAGIPGLALRAWSSGLIRKNKALAQEGPYAMVRNPLYLGSFVAGCGVAIMGANPWLAAVFIVAYLLVYGKIIRNEEAYLIQLFPQEMPAYMAAVPRFVPNFAKFAGLGSYDPVLMLRKHKEWQAWLGYLAVALLLYVKTVYPE